MPDAVRDVLSVFDVVNISIKGFGLPLQCIGLGSFAQQLAFTMLIPVGLAMIIMLGFVGRHACRDGGGLRVALIAALPWLLTLSFLVFPMVSSAAFRAFACELFDNGKSYLRTDYGLECSTEDHISEAHENAKRLAWVAVLLFPVGISLLYACLLLHERQTILKERVTTLSQSLAFLVRDQKPSYFWWELVEAWRKLFLVGFAALIMPGSIEQAAMAFVASLIFLLAVSVAQPFRSDADNNFAKFTSFSITAIFFFTVILKVGVLVEHVDRVQLRNRFGLDMELVTVGMLISILGASVLAVGIAAAQIVGTVQLPTIKLKATNEAPALPLQTIHEFHMFLSHVWGTGQDQCALSHVSRVVLPSYVGLALFAQVRHHQTAVAVTPS